MCGVLLVAVLAQALIRYIAGWLLKDGVLYTSLCAVPVSDVFAYQVVAVRVPPAVRPRHQLKVEFDVAVLRHCHVSPAQASLATIERVAANLPTAASTRRDVDGTALVTR